MARTPWEEKYVDAEKGKTVQFSGPLNPLSFAETSNKVVNCAIGFYNMDISLLDMELTPSLS